MCYNVLNMKKREGHTMLEKDILKTLLDEERISQLVDKVANEINRDFKGKDLLFVIVLKGSMPFASDLIRKVNANIIIDYIQASSYANSTVSSGNIKIKKDLEIDCKGKNVFIIEDIIDSGNTLFALKNLIKERGAACVKVCTLLSKPERRTANIEGDYVGTEIPDEFVVGYGLDYDEKYRNLPYIGVLNPEVYTN